MSCVTWYIFTYSECWSEPSKWCSWSDLSKRCVAVSLRSSVGVSFRSGVGVSLQSSCKICCTSLYFIDFSIPFSPPVTQKIWLRLVITVTFPATLSSSKFDVICEHHILQLLSQLLQAGCKDKADQCLYTFSNNLKCIYNKSHQYI